MVATLSEGTRVAINLPVGDPDGDPLDVTWAGADSSLTITESGTVLTITSDGSNADPPPFTYEVSDGDLTASAEIDLNVIVCSVSGLTSSELDNEIERRNGNKRLVADVTFTVSYNGPCTDLVLEYDHNLSDGYDATYLSFGSGTTVTFDGHPGGLAPWSLGPHNIVLRDGIGGPTILTIGLEVVPE